MTKSINFTIIHFSLLPWMLTGNNATLLFSLVISSPMNLVEFGTGLFLSKTPSEEAPHDVFSAPGYVISRSAAKCRCAKYCNVLPMMVFMTTTSYRTSCNWCFDLHEWMAFFTLISTLFNCLLHQLYLFNCSFHRNVVFIIMDNFIRPEAACVCICKSKH